MKPTQFPESTASLPFESSGQSPFDAIKRTRPDGSHYWSARDLMPVMGYTAWRNFEVPLNRAMKSAEVQGHDVNRHFAGSRKVSASGPDMADFELTRFAAYLVAMNGDPNKPEVAAAQAYFAVKTREAETRQPMSREELLSRAMLEAGSVIAELEAKTSQLEAKVEADKPKVLFADSVASSDDCILIRELAKLIGQNGIDIGGNRLFATLRAEGYLIKSGSDRNSPTQKARELGLFRVVETSIIRPDGAVMVKSTTKVTGKGQQYFVERFLDGRLKAAA